MVDVPGSAGLLLVAGIAHLNEESAVFEAMLTGWGRQQQSRLLGSKTVTDRARLVRRFTEFADSYPWAWGPGDVEDFTVSLASGPGARAPSTIRGYHLALRMFCDYVTDARYGWLKECRDRFAAVPSQVCHEWNTVAHLNEYEGRPARRPLTYGELQDLFDHLDGQVERAASSGRKGALSALRDAQIFKTAYAFGLRRNELCRLDVADLRPNPHVPRWGTYGSVHVRYGKAVRGGVPRRRTVLAVPEFDWAIEGMRQWVEQARPLFKAPGQPALWVTERLSRVSLRHLDARFADVREQVGLDPALSLHCLRHSYVTHLIEFGYPERFVQEQVGHAYASTTAIYASVSNDFKDKTLKAALARVYAPTDQEDPS
ncbi:tyrosine-type recombinase/integrase [Ornithinimicrobium pratense]|uniref:Tyrosine-type recombinase/integrase n=1 Tax=Ornithinimicrobium pratense TaxID=2593973 RepID=A0A5J6V8M8_9MICO|nr:tyrosine-type recombinase/integrase [Ornithinimicrobium pratense]QFG69506.1 tyrosine-type recombinase/integrase [Ornithinimicrobium pratense]